MTSRIAIHDATSKIHEKLRTNLESLYTGFALSFLRRADLAKLSEAYYNSGSNPKDYDYTAEDYNRSGLFRFERESIADHFPPSPSTILIVAAGGGRETLALAKDGYSVTGWECVPQLVAVAQKLLKDSELDSQVKLASADECPSSETIFDAAIVGWAAYTHIRGRSTRVAMLRQLASQLHPGAPLLLSFYAKETSQRDFKKTAAVANTLSLFTRGDKVEVGDDFQSTFVHYFGEDEIRHEFDSAGFDVVSYDAKPYGHAIGKKRN